MKVKLIELKQPRLSARQVLVNLTEANFEDNSFVVTISAWHGAAETMDLQDETINFYNYRLAIEYIEQYNIDMAYEFVQSFKD